MLLSNPRWRFCLSALSYVWIHAASIEIWHSEVQVDFLDFAGNQWINIMKVTTKLVSI